MIRTSQIYPRQATTHTIKRELFKYNNIQQLYVNDQITAKSFMKGYSSTKKRRSIEFAETHKIFTRSTTIHHRISEASNPSFGLAKLNYE